MIEMIAFTIDGKKVEAEKGSSILRAALHADIYIPHLCSHPDLPDAGECKMCIVEIEGREGVFTSCTTPAEDGMAVYTDSDKVKHLRTLSMELMLASHPSDCTSCPQYLKCELQSLIQYVGASDTRLRKLPMTEDIQTENPLFIRDMNRCIKCGRCVRACRQLRGCNVIDYRKKDGKTWIGTRTGGLLADENCRFCCACVEVCPTGALRDKDEWMSKFPKREENLLPCKASCPAGTDVPRYVRLIREGRYAEAVAVVRERVPFPLTLGYICMAFCEANCRRSALNEAVSIRELKKYASLQDTGLWKKNKRKMPPTGKKVAVIGAGPAGMTAAYYLSSLGHEVTVFEKLPYAGGMLKVGIPEYRLPCHVFGEEIRAILENGVRLKLNSEIRSLDSLMEEGYSAVLVAIGTHKGIRLPIEGNDLEGVLVNTDFLRAASLKEKIAVGKNVLVLGGGNVAFDCARSAVRMGAGAVSMACLEARDNMTASADEIRAGLEEGITIVNSQTFHRVVRTETGLGVVCSDVESFCFDENRRLKLNIRPDSEHTLNADTVIFAVGQRSDIPPEYGIAADRGNRIVVDRYRTDKQGIFAAGDAVLGTSSVVQSIASARGAAEEIDRYLGGRGDIREVLAPAEQSAPYIGEAEKFAASERQAAECDPADRRTGGFAEYERPLSAEAAHKEAERCLQCDLRLRIQKVKFWGDYSHS